MSIGFYLGSLPRTQNESEEVDAAPVDIQDIPDGDLSAIKAGSFEPCKLVLVVRKDIKLGGADVATESSATLACYRALSKANPSVSLVSISLSTLTLTRIRQAKIALQGKHERQLIELEEAAKRLNLCARAVKNSILCGGNGGERTVLAIGPAPVSIINQVTGKLRLL
ncbi:peptidyl-tRNA hydrolase PTH2-domain-containing protein [Mucidula mucida]|nr:peptidyl-tRNA hydrolase PTH2-domain-containing protein [Mucidula mucida]